MRAGFSPRWSEPGGGRLALSLEPPMQERLPPMPGLQVRSRVATAPSPGLLSETREDGPPTSGLQTARWSGDKSLHGPNPRTSHRAFQISLLLVSAKGSRGETGIGILSPLPHFEPAALTHERKQ